MENRYDRYKDSGIAWIGKIPEHWNISLIGRYFKEINNPNSAQEETNTLQFKLGEIIPKSSGNSKYNPESIESYNIVGPGTIMINGLNLSFDFISQRVAQVKEKGAITSSYIAIYPTDKLFSNYATFLLKSYDNCKALHAMGKGLRAILSYNILRSESIIIPPLAEQQAIADYLDRRCSEIDELIALQEEMITKLQSYKQSVITEAVTRGLDKNVPLKDSGIDWIGKVPEHWEITLFKRKITINNGKDYKNFSDAEIYPVIGSGGCFAYCSNYMYDGEALLLGRKGTIDKPLYVKGKFWAVDTMFYAIPHKDLHCKFSYYLALTFPFNLYSTSTSLPSLTQTDLGNIPVAFPSISEQQAIADYLDQRCSEIDELIALKQQKIEKLKEYKKSLIFECVTGKRKVS